MRHRGANVRAWLPGLLLATVLACSGRTEDTQALSGYSGTVEGVTVYLGVLPSAMLRRHPPDHAESSMHDGPSAARGEHHVLISHAVFIYRQSQP